MQRATVLVEVEVRGRKILVMNTVRTLQFAVTGTFEEQVQSPGSSGILWLLQELERDLAEHLVPSDIAIVNNHESVGNFKQVPRNGAAACSADSATTRALEQARERILGLEGVSSCVWCPSRNSFKICAGDRVISRAAVSFGQAQSKVTDVEDAAVLTSIMDDLVESIRMSLDGPSLDDGPEASEA